MSTIANEVAPVTAGAICASGLAVAGKEAGGDCVTAFS
jgi:hypothetical protein